MQPKLHCKTPKPCNLRWVFLPFFIFYTLPCFCQELSFTFNKAGLEDVFRAIENKTEFRFIYTREVLKEAKPVSMQLQHATIEAVLDRVFKDQPLGFTISKKYISVHLKE